MHQGVEVIRKMPMIHFFSKKPKLLFAKLFWWRYGGEKWK